MKECLVYDKTPQSWRVLVAAPESQAASLEVSQNQAQNLPKYEAYWHLLSAYYLLLFIT